MKSNESKELRSVEVQLANVMQANWETLEVAEEAFKQSVTFHEYALLISSIAAWQISEKRLYYPKFKSLNAYLLESATRLDVSRNYFFQRIRIAEAYIRHRGELRKAGFREHRDASKLRIFFKAEQMHGTAAAIEQLPKLSYNAYKRWVNQNILPTEEREFDEIEYTRDGYRIRGELIISTKAVTKIVEDGEEPFLLGVRSDQEKHAIIKYLKQRRIVERGNPTDIVSK